MADVYLHVGLPKTGTTSIQAALDGARERLAACDIAVPGRSHQDHRLAAFDLLGQRVKGEDGPVVAGALDRLIAELDTSAARAAIVSDEELAIARPRQVQRLVSRLANHRVFLVVTARDLARTVVSVWQQWIIMGSSLEWAAFSAAVRDHDSRFSSAGAAFWLRHDVARVLQVWGQQIPASRIRLVTVPNSSADPGLLLDRFGVATTLPSDWAGEAPLALNASLGVAELECLRRLNASVVSDLSQRQHRHLVEQGIRRNLRRTTSRAPVLPREDLAWVQDRGAALVGALRDLPYEVHGNLSELLPDPRHTTDSRPDDLSDSELVEAMESVLSSLAISHAQLFRRLRQQSSPQVARPTPAAMATSWLRAEHFALRKAALHHSGENAVVAWAVRRYLGATRSTGHSPGAS